MSATLTIDQLQQRSRFAEGILLLTAVVKNIFIVNTVNYVGAKFIISSISSIEKKLDLKNIDKEEVEKVYPVFRDLANKFQTILPIIGNERTSFISKKDKEKLFYYYEYIEDVVEAMEIGLDTPTKEKIETLAQTATATPNDIPPWRDILDQI